jgi:hypothetical protein
MREKSIRTQYFWRNLIHFYEKEVEDEILKQKISESALKLLRNGYFLELINHDNFEFFGKFY